MKSLLHVSMCLLLLGSVLVADEGMWLFNNPPRSAQGEDYGFDPTTSGSSMCRKSSVRSSGGSGSFVSADGLVMTNHHVGLDCLQKLSSKAKDYDQERLPRQDTRRGSSSAISNSTCSTEIDDVTDGERGRQAGHVAGGGRHGQRGHASTRSKRNR